MIWIKQAGLGGSFTNENGHNVMKYKESMVSKNYDKWGKAIEEE
jgi:hypothetical protein